MHYKTRKLTVATLTLIGLLCLISPFSHALTQEQWRAFNLQTVDHYILPAYQSLAIKAQQLKQASQTVCKDPKNNSAENLASTRLAFHETMDAWQHIQNVQFGPIQILMRNYSMQFWPDKKNHVSKQLAQLLSSQDPQALSDAEFHKASVSIKGLPAIERFLFEQDASQALLEKPFHCQVLMRIATYTAESAQAIANEWQEMKQHFVDTQQEDSYFEDDMDAAISLLKSLIEPIEVIRDLKLLRPMGSEFGQQRVTRLESWRSERSLRNIQLNIASLWQLYQGTDSETERGGLSALLDQQTHASIKEQFALLQQQLATIPDPIEQSMETREGYAALAEMSQSLKALHEQLESAVAGLGLHLGFNSRDGD